MVDLTRDACGRRSYLINSVSSVTQPSARLVATHAVLAGMPIVRQRWLRDREPADLELELIRIEACARGAPVAKSQFDVAITWPERQDAEHIPQIHFGVELVEPCGGDQGKEIGGSLTMIVTANEQPSVTACGESPFILPMLASSPW